MTWISRQFTATLKAEFPLRITEKNVTPTQLLHFRDNIACNFLYWKGILAFHRKGNDFLHTFFFFPFGCAA